MNHKVVMKLMKELGLIYNRRKKNKKKQEQIKLAERLLDNTLNRDFRADQPNQKWVIYVTEFKVGNKTIYLSALLDLFNREIVSYTISDKISLASTLEMLENAFVNLPKKNELIIHSDCGWQYQTEEYQSCLAKRAIVQSMSRKGDWDCAKRLDTIVSHEAILKDTGVTKNATIYRRIQTRNS